MNEQTLVREQLQGIILQYPKHYIKVLKNNYTHILNDIEKWNYTIHCEYTMDIPQKVFNFLNNIKEVPRCSFTKKQLMFVSSLKRYRKTSSRRFRTKEMIDSTSKKRKGIFFKKDIKDYKNFEANIHDFNEIKIAYNALFENDTFNGSSQKLSTRYPELKHAIHKFYNYYEPFRACLYCLRNDIQTIPLCEIDKITQCEYLGGEKGFKKTSSKNAPLLKKANKETKLNKAEVLPEIEFLIELRKRIQQLNNYQNLKQSLMKISPSLVKSVYHYTSKNEGVKKFSERCYILLNGVPQKSENKVKLHYQSFYEGYQERFKHSNDSKGECELRDFIEQELKIQTSKFRDPYEVDIFIPSKNIGIEYNGIYYHSTPIKDKNYHNNKTQHFFAKGIQIIHVLETEWYQKPNIVKSIISSKLGIYHQKIYARNCTIKEIDYNTKRKFLEDNHIQGDDKSFSYAGLYHVDKLVAVMTFCKRKITGSLTIELSRFCSLLHTQIIGGASKLLKFLLQKNKDIKMVTTYADIRYSAMTKTYEKLGFTFKHNSSPDYFYFKPCMPEYCKLYHRSNFMKHKLVSKLAVYDDRKTEFENMEANGYLKIYDCGNKVYTMINPFYTALLSN